MLFEWASQLALSGGVWGTIRTRLAEAPLLSLWPGIACVGMIGELYVDEQRASKTLDSHEIGMEKIPA